VQRLPDVLQPLRHQLSLIDESSDRVGLLCLLVLEVQAASASRSPERGTEDERALEQAGLNEILWSCLDLEAALVIAEVDRRDRPRFVVVTDHD
jgi:hypothetical protein